MFPADPSPDPRPALLAVLPSRAVVAHESRAAVSAALSVEAFAPPVPSFEIADIAAAGIVRALCAVAPARTVAISVVLKTDAWLDARNERRTSGI